MAQYSDPAKQFGGDFSGQAGPQGQGFYPQQGPAGPLPQGLYPTMMQQPGHMQFPVQASQQGSPAPYEQQYPQSQVPGGAYLGTPQPSAGTLPYPQQQNMPLGENASYYGTVPQDQYGNPVGPGGPEDDKRARLDSGRWCCWRVRWSQAGRRAPRKRGWSGARSYWYECSNPSSSSQAIFQLE
ncbi:hypothetical protein MYU51_018157 [Penicillium brevicompactum]